jgi:RNA-directed DNA polymerase
MPVFNETLAVLGCGPQAASIALREALRFKIRRGTLIVQDATGRGATLLSLADKTGIERRRMVWVDLADRRHPVSLFQIRRSPHFRGIWARVLRSVRDIAGWGIGDGVLDWAAEAAYSLSADGSVGLGAIFRCLSSAETRRWFLDTKNEPSDLGKLLDLFAWVLSFPAVHAVSEGENRGNLLDALSKPSVLWLECAVEHFEPKEYLLVQLLVEAALEDALRVMASESERWQETTSGLTVLHLHPAELVALPIEGWVQACSGAVRHVGVHRLEPDRPLPPKILCWAQRSEFLWVTGPGSALRRSCLAKWLSPTEISRLGELVNGELWIRSNRSGKSLVARPRVPPSTPGEAHGFRVRASERRRPASIGQVAAAVRSLASPAGTQRGLYARLCEIETLRMAWFRARESRTRCSGVDGVTVASFARVAEAELTALSAELRSGRYRPRPLRRIQIPKSDGGVRNLGVACLRDRVVQAACLALLEPVFEPVFNRFSFGFRPGRSAHQAVAAARAMIASGRLWAVIADVRKCFDNIDHEVLLGLLAERIADEELLALIRGWLAVDVLEFRDLLPTEIGVPQGESISPLLANVYLDPLDRHFERLGLAFVRYADDFVVFTGSEEEAQEAHRRLADFLRDVLRLELKPAKTFYTPVSEGFDFLGFRIAGSTVTVKPDKVQALLDYLGELLQDLGHAVGSLDKTAGSLSRMNSVVRGWRNYFLLPGEPSLAMQMSEIDERIEGISSGCLPQALRENPAWLCRERLSMAADDIGGSGDAARRNAPQPGQGYPGEDPPEAPIGWNGAGGTLREAPKQSEADLGEKAQGENAPAGSAADTAPVEDGDRLYVLAHGTYVTADGEQLLLRKRRVEYYRRPMDKIGLVYLQGFGIGVSVDAQVKLAQHDVPVVLALPLGNPVAVINAIETSHSSLRRLQAIRRDEPDVLAAGIRMIAAKISNQAAVLKYFAKYRKRVDPEEAASLTACAGELVSLSASVSGVNPGEATVRGAVLGYEGHAAALYWRQLARLFPTELSFGGRVTLSAQDPVNQCLNYIYGLLYGEVWRAVLKAGLDPYFGLIHGSVRDQGSLVFDLIEEFRAPFGDRIVVSMLSRGFRPEIGSHGFLRTRSKRQLVRSFTKRWARTVRYRSDDLAPASLLLKQADSLAEVFRQQGSYHPYHMKW